MHVSLGKSNLDLIGTLSFIVGFDIKPTSNSFSKLFNSNNHNTVHMVYKTAVRFVEIASLVVIFTYTLSAT